MINIFSRINKQLASWTAFWQFLRGLDHYTLSLYQDLDGPVAVSEDEPGKEAQEHRDDKIIVRFEPNTCIHAGSAYAVSPPSSTSRKTSG